MARGTARTFAVTVLGLIALQAVGTREGSGRITELLNDLNGILQHALDPKVPAIPDLRNGGSWASSAPTTTSRPRPNSAYDMGPQTNRVPIPGVPMPS